MLHFASESTQRDFYSDNFSQKIANDDLNIIEYSSLKPAGHIKIIIHEIEPLTEQDLDVRSQDGPAKLGLSGERIWSYIPNALLSVFAFTYVLLSVRAMRTEWLLHECYIHPIKAIKSKRPMILSQKAWIECLERATERAGKRELYETGDICTWGILRLKESFATTTPTAKPNGRKTPGSGVLSNQT